MNDQVLSLQNLAIQAISQAGDLKSLEALELRFLGKKGELTALLRETGKLPESERPAFGQAVNQAKQAVQQHLDGARGRMEGEALKGRLQAEAIDVTLPGRPPALGSLHPVSRITRECCDIFSRLGFNIELGPELEDDFHNFGALNVPADHPARDAQDSYYIGGQVLRTHTSSVQIRVMQRRKPPIRMIAPGRVFRRDATDATHGAQFHQLEGLAVDAYGKVRLTDLKGTLEAFIHLSFGRQLKSRFRPSFFPFTEPSLEVDMQCFKCKGSGCGICKQSGWIELGGAGMVHPNVFKAVGYEEGAWAGFAFGFGLDRIAMLKWGIPDVRMFYANDLRFLAQF